MAPTWPPPRPVRSASYYLALISPTCLLCSAPVGILQSGTSLQLSLSSTPDPGWPQGPFDIHHGPGPHPPRPGSGGPQSRKEERNLSLLSSVTSVAGPMARDVESLVLCLRALLSEDMHRLDPTVPFMPFREEVSWPGEQAWRAPTSSLPSFLIDKSTIWPSSVKTSFLSPRSSDQEVLSHIHLPPLLNTSCFGLSATLEP